MNSATAQERAGTLCTLAVQPAMGTPDNGSPMSGLLSYKLYALRRKVSFVFSLAGLAKPVGQPCITRERDTCQQRWGDKYLVGTVTSTTREREREKNGYSENTWLRPVHGLMAGREASDGKVNKRKAPEASEENQDVHCANGKAMGFDILFVI